MLVSRFASRTGIFLSLNIKFFINRSYIFYLIHNVRDRCTGRQTDSAVRQNVADVVAASSSLWRSPAISKIKLKSTVMLHVLEAGANKYGLNKK